MNEKFTNVILQDFLDDHLKNSNTFILEEGKEKNDLYKIAEAKGIKIEGSKDLAIFKNIYALPDKANKNGARLPKKELLEKMPKIIGKPINLEHDRKRVVGFYIDYSYKQKKEEMITYGIFFKSCFPEDWARVEKAFKEKRLNTSYEIWCPLEKRKKLNDGTYELLEQEPAGGALLIENEPAFDECKVLELAKKTNIPNDLKDSYLEYSSKYESNDIITANTSDTNIKTIVSDSSIDFFVRCPDCKNSAWETIEKTDTNSKIKCLSCKSAYELSYEQEKVNENIKKLYFLFDGSIQCFQCGNNIPISQLIEGGSSINRTVKCNRCNLEFPFNLAKKEIKKMRTMKRIENLVEDKIINSSTGGDMKKEELEVQPIEEVKPIEVVEEVKPAEAEVKPVEEEVKSAEAEVKPVEEEVKPAEAEVKPVEVEVKPVEEVVEEAKIEKSKYKNIVKKAVSKIRNLKKSILENSSKNKEIEKVLTETSQNINSYKGVIENYEEELAKVKEDSKIKELELIAKVEKAQKEIEKSESFYKENAKKIIETRIELGNFVKDLSDEQLLDEKEITIARLKKENEEIKGKNIEVASTTISVKNKDTELDNYYRTFRKKVDKEINFNEFTKKDNEE